MPLLRAKEDRSFLKKAQTSMQEWNKLLDAVTGSERGSRGDHSGSSAHSVTRWMMTQSSPWTAV